MKKDIQKCVRMTQETYDYIMTFNGDGFNQKFENACAMFRNKDKHVKKLISVSERELNDVMKQVSDYRELRSKLFTLERYIDLLIRQIPD